MRAGEGRGGRGPEREEGMEGGGEVWVTACMSTPPALLPALTLAVAVAVAPAPPSLRFSSSPSANLRQGPEAPAARLSRRPPPPPHSPRSKSRPPAPSPAAACRPSRRPAPSPPLPRKAASNFAAPQGSPRGGRRAAAARRNLCHTGGWFAVQAYSHRVQAANTLCGIRVGWPHLGLTHLGSTGTLVSTNV